MSWQKNKKKQNQKNPASFWSILFSYSMQQQWTISRLDCDMQWKVDFIQQPVMTTSVDGPRKSSKALPKAKLAPPKFHGQCLVVCCPSDPLQLSESWWTITSENHWKLQVLQPSLVNRKGPNLLWDNASHTTNTSKVECIGVQSFASSAIFFWPLANRLPLLQASWRFLTGNMPPQPAASRKCSPSVRWILKHRFLLYRSKQTYLL